MEIETTINLLFTITFTTTMIKLQVPLLKYL